MLKKPNDLQVREAVETIFNVQPGELKSGRFDTSIRSRELLHHWTLSRVERLVFRSEQLPSIIFKVALEPLQGEMDLYTKVFEQNPRWTPTLYGHTTIDDQAWMFFEDLGSRTLKSEPTIENLQSVTTMLASFHASFNRSATDGSLYQSVHLPVFDHKNYLLMAQETLKLTTALSQRGVYPSIDSRKLSRLEMVVNGYDRVAIGLVGAPQSLVHGDFNPDNVLFKTDQRSFIPGDTNDRIYVIDWANSFIGACLVDLVDLVNFGITRFGLEIMPKMLSDYRQAWQIIKGEQLASEPLEELFVCCQIHKKMSLVNWFNRCSIRWIPTGVQAYNSIISGLIDELYELSTILV